MIEIDSPVAATRLVAKRDREILALRILGFLEREDGTLQEGTPEEREAARKWLV